MKKILAILVLAQLLLSNTCTKEDDGTICTMEARAGLNVTVTLENNTALSPEGITVTAVDGNFSEVLINNDANTANFVGAFERPGTYIVTVVKSGYKTFVSEAIIVTADECHVISKIVNVQLEEE